MEKIELTDKAKIYLLLIFNEEEFAITNKMQTLDLALLEYEELITNNPTCEDEFGYGNMEITPKGMAYLAVNPKLENPSIFKDMKFLTQNAITIITAFFS